MCYDSYDVHYGKPECDTDLYSGSGYLFWCNTCAITNDFK